MFNTQFIKSAARPGDFPDDTGVELAVVGRSNSGKSSAINAIVGSKKLARVSKTPGRTQLINFFSIGDDRRLVDLPGYGFARVPDKVRADWNELIGAYFEGRRSIAGLLITVDIRRGLNELDRRMLDWAAELDIPTIVLLTKADKLSRGGAQAQAHALRKDVSVKVKTIPFSALKGMGVEEARVELRACLALD